MTTLLTLILAANLSLPAKEMAAHLVVCEKALRGDFGKLAPWQVEGYKVIAEHRAVRKLAWITHYATGEPEVGTLTASGRRVESGRTLAMLDVPFGTFVLLDLPSGFTLRQVWDRGSRANLPRARRKGAQTWCDVYRHTRSRRILNTSWVREVWIAK